jgi:hypothetical protein
LHWAALFLVDHSGDSWSNPCAEVFNMFVENLVEKQHGIFVSDSAEDASTLCTGAGADTFVAKRQANPGLDVRS